MASTSSAPLLFLVATLVLLISCAQWAQVQCQEPDSFASTDPASVSYTYADDTSSEDSYSTYESSTYEPGNDDEYNRPPTTSDPAFASFWSDPEYSNPTEIVDNPDLGTGGNSTSTSVVPDHGPNAEGFDLVEDDDEDTSNSTSSAGASFAARGGGCGTGNPVDDCWRCDPNWAANRQRLANCAIGFGKGAIGGKNGRIYVVTSAADDNPANPAPGTLRYAVTRPGPLWITFATSMTIRLKNELLITSFKTIDGRGVSVRIAGGGGLTMQLVSNIIVHGIAITDIKATGPGRIMTSTAHVGTRGRCDGDAISIFSSKNIWIDHCYFARGADGQIDVIKGSTAVSITNNFFTQHDKVMLLGAHKGDYLDRSMYVTVAYNIFGPGLMQRMPRVRFGNVHVMNNDYTSGWGVYAIAGSEGPTILSQGNIFNAFKGSKEVTKRIDDGGATFGGPGNWNWKSEGDRFLSGAFFTRTRMSWSGSSFSKTASSTPRPVALVETMVRGAGPLICRQGARC